MDGERHHFNCEINSLKISELEKRIELTDRLHDYALKLAAGDLKIRLDTIEKSQTFLIKEIKEDKKASISLLLSILAIICSIILIILSQK